MLIVAIIVSMALSPLACQYGVELARCGARFGACFFLLLGFGVEACEEVANDEVCDQGL